MDLIVRSPRIYHVSQDTVMEAADAMLRDPRVRPAKTNPVFGPAATIIAKLAQRTGLNAGSVTGARRRVSLTAVPNRDYLAVMMGLDVAGCAPWFVLRARKSVYMFDAWPQNHAEIRTYVESWGVQYAFVSSSQAAERLAAISDRCTFIWVPEGVDTSRYHWCSYIEKDIDVLQLGRRYDAHHAIIAPALEQAGKKYLYERIKGTIVFPARDEFIDGLARTRISICVPSSVTHPARAGDIETMTARYLQSIASKCLVLGRAPAEMVELFGYDPVVEIDMADPAGQILHILDTFEDYTALIERNFDRVVNDHTWTRRWERIAAVLFPDVTPFPKAAPLR